MTEGVNLDDQRECVTFVFPHADERVEKGFPVAISGEIVVGDKELGDPDSCVVADDILQILRRSEPAAAPLDVMMQQKLHSKGQPRPRSKLP